MRNLRRIKVTNVFDSASGKGDAYLIKDNFFAVFDGFDSLKTFKDEKGVSGGLIASKIAREAFSVNKGTLRDLTIEANQKIKERMRSLKVNMKNKSNLWGTVFSCVRVESDFFGWAQMGDCLILLIYKDDSYKLLVQDYDHDGEVLTMWKELAKQKRENIRKILDAGPLVELRSKVNEVYGALNGESEALSFLNSGMEKLESVKHILLFTDGLIIPK